MLFLTGFMDSVNMTSFHDISKFVHIFLEYLNCSRQQQKVKILIIATTTVCAYLGNLNLSENLKFCSVFIICSRIFYVDL